MYICGIVSFSISFRVTRGFVFLVPGFDVFVISLGVLANVFQLVDDAGGKVDGILVDVDVCRRVVNNSVVVC